MGIESIPIDIQWNISWLSSHVRRLFSSSVVLSVVLHRHREFICFFLTYTGSDRIPRLVNYIEASARQPGFGYYLVN
jgi:hypothetical protein